MRFLIIAIVVVGVIFLAMMFFGPGTGPSREANRAEVDNIENNGPNPFLEMLGGLTAPLAPKVAVKGQGGCPAGQRFAEAGSGYRVLPVRLTSGLGAVVSYRGFDQPREGEERPTRLCLKADGANPSITADCHNNKRESEGTLAIGPKGGCIAIEPISATIAAGEVKYNCPSDGNEPADCPD